MAENAVPDFEDIPKYHSEGFKCEVEGCNFVKHGEKHSTESDAKDSIERVKSALEAHTENHLQNLLIYARERYELTDPFGDDYKNMIKWEKKYGAENEESKAMKKLFKLDMMTSKVWFQDYWPDLKFFVHNRHPLFSFWAHYLHPLSKADRLINFFTGFAMALIGSMIFPKCRTDVCCITADACSNAEEKLIPDACSSTTWNGTSLLNNGVCDEVAYWSDTVDQDHPCQWATDCNDCYAEFGARDESTYNTFPNGDGVFCVNPFAKLLLSIGWGIVIAVYLVILKQFAMCICCIRERGRLKGVCTWMAQATAVGMLFAVWALNAYLLFGTTLPVQWYIFFINKGMAYFYAFLLQILMFNITYLVEKKKIVNKFHGDLGAWVVFKSDLVPCSMQIKHKLGLDKVHEVADKTEQPATSV